MEVMGWILFGFVAALIIWQSTRKHGTAGSFSKSAELRRLSRELGASPFAKGGDVVVNFLESTRKKNQSLNKLFDLCEADPNVSRIMQENGVQRADLEDLYEQLILGGAGQWLAGHFVAASSLAFAQTLDYALRNLRGGDKASILEVTARLCDYFEGGEVGPIND